MADRFVKISVPVLANEQVALGHYVMTLGDAEMGRMTRPGQFYQVRLKGSGAPFLPRPFSIFDWSLDASGEVTGFKILYRVVGRGTEALSALAPGDEVAVTGPLGNTFSIPEPGKRVILAAGGIGIAPFMAFVRASIDRGVSPEHISVAYGARTRALIVAADVFEALGVEVSFATDDGTLGVKGTTLDLLERCIGAGDAGEVAIYASGPTPMLEAVALFCRARGIQGELTLEARMVCGVAVCNSCAIRVISPDDPDGWQYKLVCRDGPVFAARSLYVE